MNNDPFRKVSRFLLVFKGRILTEFNERWDYRNQLG